MILELGKAIAALGEDYRVSITVDAVDEKTESVTAVIEGAALELEAIAETINGMGGSIHSIDEVEVTGAADAKS